MDQEVKDKIYDMWQKDMPSSAIAAELEITRNSVIGVIYRFRKNGKATRGRIKARKPVKIFIKPKKEKKEKVKGVKKVKPQIVQKIEPDQGPFIGICDQNVTLEGLNFYSCRFIVNEGFYDEALYCGRKIHKESYCNHHYSICYHPSKRTLDSLVSKI